MLFGILPSRGAVKNSVARWGYGADDAVSIIMPEDDPYEKNDEEFSFARRSKGISLENDSIVNPTREELFFARPEGECFVNQACNLIRIEVTAYPEAAWAEIKVGLEVHDDFKDAPEVRAKNSNTWSRESSPVRPDVCSMSRIFAEPPIKTCAAAEKTDKNPAGRRSRLDFWRFRV